MRKKKIFSTLLAVTLSAAMVIPSIAQGGSIAEWFTASREKTLASVSEETASEMKLWYDEPATALNSYDTWQQATLPIGNGILGANVYGELREEHLSLNEETLWSGGRGSVDNYNGGNPSTSKVDVYNGLANYYLNGTSTSYNVENLAGVSQSASGYNDSYQALGDLYFAFENAPSSTPADYVRMLDLDNGISTVAYTNNNVEYTRTYFASNPDNVIVGQLTASGDGNLNFTTRIASKQNGTSTSSVENNVGTIVNAGTVANNGLIHNTQVRIEVDAGTVTASGGTITVSGANTATIYLSAATDYKNTFYNSDNSISYYYRTGENADQVSARVAERLSAASRKGYAKVLADHKEDYKELYSRVDLNLGQSNEKTTDALLDAYQNNSASAAEKRYLEVLLFQYGRYLLIAGSRENSQLPTNLQGIWNDKNSAPWGSDIHTNINEQMNYWLSNNCNLTECALPLVQYMANLEIPGGRTVEIYTGSQHGIMAHTQNTPFGYTSPGWSIGTWGWSPAAATWLLQNCYDYYQYSGDKATLENVLYPVLKDQVLMYQELLKDKDGRKVMPITQSPELSTITAGNTYEQSLIWQLYADTIEAAEILGEDSATVASWKTTMDQLKPIEIGNSGQVKEWYHETSINSVNDTSSHRHLSNLLGLYPGDLFDTQEELNAAIVSLNNKNFGRVGTSNNPEGGWTYGQLIGSWARVGSGENAYYSVSQMIKNRLYDNLWDWHTGYTYGAFQIDANYGYSAGVAEMLVQSNLGYINTLPALPQEWAAGSVDGLLTEGGFEVDMDWTAGELTTMNITSKNGGNCAVKVDIDVAERLNVADRDGNPVECTVENGIYTFATVKGDTYTITREELPKVENLAAVENEDGTVTLTWDTEDGVTYAVYRKNASTAAYAEGSNSEYGELLADSLTEGTYTDSTVETGNYEYTVVGNDGSIAAVKIQLRDIDLTGVIEGYYVKETPNSDAPAEVEDGIYVIVGAHSGNANYAMTANTDLTRVNVASNISGDKLTPENTALEWKFTWADTGYKMESVANPGMYMTFTETDSNTGVTIRETSDPQLIQLDYVNAAYQKSVHIGGITLTGAPRASYLNFRGNRIGSYNGNWGFPDDGSTFYLYEKDYEIRAEKVNELTATVGETEEYTENSWSAYNAALAGVEGVFETYEEAAAAYKALATAIENLAPVDPEDVAEKVYVKAEPKFGGDVEQPVPDGTYVIVGAHINNNASGKVITRGSTLTSFTCPSISNYFENSQRIIRTDLSSAEWKFAYQGTVNDKKTFTISAKTESGTVYLDTSSSLTTTTTVTALNVVDTSNHYPNSVGIGSDAAAKKYLNYNQGASNVSLWSVDAGSTWYLYGVKYDIKDADVQAVITEAGVAAEEEYTPESWSAYQKALKAAEGLFDTEREAVAVYDAFVVAVEALEEILDATDYDLGIAYRKYAADFSAAPIVPDGTYVILGGRTDSANNTTSVITRTENVVATDYTDLIYTTNVHLSNDVVSGEYADSEWDVTYNAADGTYVFKASNAEKYLAIYQEDSAQGAVSATTVQNLRMFENTSGDHYVSGSLVIGGPSLANGNVGYLNHRDNNPGTWDRIDQGSAWLLYEKVYQYDLQTLYKAICDANGGQFLFSESVYTSASGQTYLSTLKAAKGTFETVGDAQEALNALIAAVDGLELNAGMKAVLPKMSWLATEEADSTETESGKNFIKNLSYLNTAAMKLNEENPDEVTFEQYEALTWTWADVERLVIDDDEKVSPVWTMHENGISSRQFSSASSNETFTEADVYKISGVFEWPEGYDLHDTTVVLDSANDFYYRDVYEYLDENKLNDYFPLAQVLPINDDVYVVVWAETTEDAKPTVATINNYLAFWAGTSGKGVWTQNGFNKNDWKRTETATFLEWNLQGERTFRYSYPNLIGKEKVEDLDAANAQVEAWDYEYLDHTDGWYTLTDTYSINSVLRENYPEGIAAGTKVHVDLYVMNNSKEGMIDELEIELFTTEDPDVTVNYYLKNGSQTTLLGSEELLNIPYGTQIKLLPGVQAGQLNSYKAEAIYKAGYKEVTNGVQLGSVPYVVTEGKDNVIDVIYTLAEEKTLTLTAASAEYTYNGTARIVDEVTIVEAGYEEAAVKISEGTYRLPDGNIIKNVYSYVEETLPGIYTNNFAVPNGVTAADYVVEEEIEGVQSIDVTNSYIINTVPGELKITYTPETVTKIYDFGVENKYADILTGVELSAQASITADNATISVGDVTYTPQTVNVGETVEIALKFAGDYIVTKAINFVPASNVLYEENFAEITPDADDETPNSWSVDGTAATKVVEDNDGTVYGYTGAYAATENYSNGSALKATLGLNDGTGIPAMTAKTLDKMTFEFTGTGFDLISRCGEDTGMLMVKVVGETRGTTKAYLVDTYFRGVKKDVDLNGDGVIQEDEKNLPDALASTGAYQVPVVKALGLPYDKYTVTVYGYLLNTAGAVTTYSRGDEAPAVPVEDILAVALEDFGMEDVDVADVEVSYMDDNSVLNGGSGNVYAESSIGRFTMNVSEEDTPAEAKDTAYVYVDGFRVYQPLEDDRVYVAAEQGTIYRSVYDFVKTSVNELTTDAMLYLEYDGDTGSAAVADYKTQGPQNEVYLTGGNAVAFALDKYTEGNIVQIGAKAVAGAAKLSSDGGVNSTTVYTTEMYYNVEVQTTASGVKYVLIKNTGDEGTVLALSGLKIAKDIGIYASGEFGKQIVDGMEESENTETMFVITTAEKVQRDRMFTVSVETSKDVKMVRLVLPAGNKVDLTAYNAQAVASGAVETYKYSHAIVALDSHVVWTGSSTGTYTFTAIALDANGEVIGESQSISINVE